MTKIGKARRGFPDRRFLREWRLHRGLSQEKLAERIGELIQNERVGHSRISKIENGKEQIAEYMLFAWADALQVDAGALYVRPDVYQRQAEAMRLVEKLSPERATAVLRAFDDAIQKAS